MCLRIDKCLSAIDLRKRNRIVRYLLIKPSSVTIFYIFGMMYMSSMHIKGGMGMKRFITRASGNTISKS